MNTNMIVRRLMAFVALATMAAGCSIYHPQAVDIPLINHAGDTRVDASASVSALVFPDAINVNATLSHGFTDWLAGQVHVNYGGENFYTQLAPGAYLPLGEHGLLEGYAGVGFGSVWRQQEKTVTTDTSSYTYIDYEYSGRFTVPFGQVNIGWHDLTGAHIDLALGVKAGGYMPNFNYRDYGSDGALRPDGSFSYSTPSLLLEPQLVFRIGSETAKFCLRGSFTWMSDFMGDNTSGNSHNFTIDIFTLSAGVNFSF